MSGREGWRGEGRVREGGAASFQPVYSVGWIWLLAHLLINLPSMGRGRGGMGGKAGGGMLPPAAFPLPSPPLSTTNDTIRLKCAPGTPPIQTMPSISAPVPGEGPGPGPSAPCPTPRSPCPRPSLLHRQSQDPFCLGRDPKSGARPISCGRWGAVRQKTWGATQTGAEMGAAEAMGHKLSG